MPSVPDVSPYGDSQRREMSRFIPPSAGAILDVGCNTGGFGAILKKNGTGTVRGIEANSESAGIAAGRLDKVIIRYFSEEQVPDSSFEVVVFNDVLEHMVDPVETLQNAANKLKPNGVVGVSIPNIRHIDNLLHMLVEKDFRYEASGIRDTSHVRFYTEKSISRLFEQAGFEIVTLEGINESWWNPKIWCRLAFRLFRSYLRDTRYIQFAIVAKPIAR